MGMEPLFYQTGHTIVQFNGEHVAHVTSALPSKERHTEFDLFLSEHDEWILQGIGRTKVDGETDRYWAVVSDDPADILQSILGQDVSRLAKKLLVESLKHLADCVCD
jgi:hypothetical protein